MTYTFSKWAILIEKVSAIFVGVAGRTEKITFWFSPGFIFPSNRKKWDNLCEKMILKGNAIDLNISYEYKFNKKK